MTGVERVRLSPVQLKRLRTWMVAREIPGSAETLLAGLLHGGTEAVNDAAIAEVMALVDQYMALHGARWFEVLARRAVESDHDPAKAIEPELN